MSQTRFFSALLLAASTLLATAGPSGAQQPCPLQPGQTGTFASAFRADGVVAFRSGLNVNADGAPNAYHRVLGPTVRDPGLLHICNGVEVLERGPAGAMVNRYPDFTVQGSSARCKADVFALQQAGFPACETGLCLRVFGFYAPPRSCGPGRRPECGVPPMALDANGAPTPYFVSTTSLADPRYGVTDPRRYLDGRTIPHFVLPAGEGGPFTAQHGVRLGDIALIVRGQRAVFAVFADAGPAAKLGEASPAVLNRLRGQPDSLTTLPSAMGDRVTTLILPGSRGLFAEFPPRNAAAIAEAGQRALLTAGGQAAFSGCAGLAGPYVIATE